MPTSEIIAARTVYETSLAARNTEKVAAGATPGAADSQVAKVDSYVLVETDAKKTITITKGTAVTLTVPTAASVPFPIGTEIRVVQGGAGAITLTPVSGAVTISAKVGLVSSGANAVVDLEKVAANVWRATGDLAAS